MIVAVSFVTLFFTLGIRHSFSVYYIAILQEYGWGRAETAGAFSLSMIFHTIFSPVTGTLIDRIGPRKLFPLGATILFFGLLAASRINTKWQLYLVFGVVIGIGINTLSYAPHMSIIPRWFITKRGMASGIVLSGVGLGALVLVPFNEVLIGGFGWRTAFLILSGIILCFLIPVMAVFHRNSPDDVGQNLDGLKRDRGKNTDNHSHKAACLPVETKLWTLQAAMGKSAFWFILLAVIFDGFTMTMLLVHQTVHLVGLGYSKLFAASLFGIMGLLGSVGGIFGGALSDRIGSQATYTIASLFSFLGISFLLVLGETSPGLLLYSFIILFGLGNGGKMPMIATVTGDLFPGSALGRIMASQAMAYGIGGAIGPYVGGYFYDQRGSYSIPFFLLLICTALSLVSIRMTRRRHNT